MKLTLTLPGGEKKSFKVFERSFTVGRGQACTVVVPSVTLSRQHCLIEVDGDGVFITDTGSSNGVFINYNRIAANVATPYRIGEPLKFGEAEVSMNLSEVETGPIKLGTQPNIPVRNLRQKNFYNPVSGRAPRRLRREQLAERESERSIFDPINIIVVVGLIVGAIYYRQSAIKSLAKDPLKAPEAVSADP